MSLEGTGGDGPAAASLTFVGSGDAFGSGGRLQSCACLSGAGPLLLVDCGATSLVGLKRLDINPNDVGAVLLTHLHGDHFAGLPFLVLDGQFSDRTLDLTVVGPPGTQQRVEAAMEVLFPGSSTVQRRFTVRYCELVERAEQKFDGYAVTGFPVVHASGATPFALRIRYGGRTVTFSGDTEWTDSLLDAAAGSDVFVCEAYQYDRPVRFHLDYQTVRANLDRVDTGRLVLTHMSAAMLEHVGDIADDTECAHDGQVLAL